jgi:tetratricopeptide (TPR) repeat protein
LYRLQGRYGEAEPLYKKAIAIGEAALPAGHPDLAMGYNNLALLYHYQGRYGDAEPLYKKSLEILKRF